MADQSSVSYGGLNGIRAVRFPFARGVTPSTACIYTVSRADFDPSGPLVLSANGETLTFPDTAVVSAHIRRHADGRQDTTAIYVADRRWRWRGKSVSGDWNRRAADGTLDTATTKTPAELAGLILNALGESGYDTTQMPTNVRPRCYWQNERADLALARLCEYVACEVVLNPLTNLVEIWPAGVGGFSATGVGEARRKRRHAPRVYVPNRVVVNCGHSLWQTQLLLQAACRNYSDNKQKSLSQVDIRPIDGWTYEYPGLFAGVASGSRIRAFEDVYRTYRVIGQKNGYLGLGNVPFPISSPNQYVLNDYTLEVEEDYLGAKHNLPAYCDVGECWGYIDTTANASSARSLVPFKLHLDRQIVEFNTPLFKLSSTGTFQEPTLYLTTSYRVRTAEGQFAGLYRYGTVGGTGGDLIVERPELFSVYTTAQSGAQTNTEPQTIAEADAYVQLLMRKYQNPWASEITYWGLQFGGSLDGNLAQVTWEWQVNAPPQTCVYEGDELDVAALSSRRRRRDLEAAR